MGSLIARTILLFSLMGGGALNASQTSADVVKKDWATNLSDFLPAIDACVARLPKENLVPDVSIAWRQSDRVVGVRLAFNRKYFECFADVHGRSLRSFKELPLNARRRDGEGEPIFSPGATSVLCTSACKYHYVDARDNAGKYVGLLGYSDETAN